MILVYMSYIDLHIFIHILFQIQYKVSILLLLEIFSCILRFVLTAPPTGKSVCPSEQKQAD